MWAEVLGLRVISFFLLKISGEARVEDTRGGEVVSREKQKPKPPKIFPCLAPIPFILYFVVL